MVGTILLHFDGLLLVEDWLERLRNASLGLGFWFMLYSEEKVEIEVRMLMDFECFVFSEL